MAPGRVNIVSVTQCISSARLDFKIQEVFGGKRGEEKDCFMHKCPRKPTATYYDHSGDEHLRFSHLVLIRASVPNIQPPSVAYIGCGNSLWVVVVVVAHLSLPWSIG